MPGEVLASRARLALLWMNRKETRQDQHKAAIAGSQARLKQRTFLWDKGAVAAWTEDSAA